MINAKLKAYKVSKIEFNNNVKSSVKLNFNHKVEYNVSYSNGSACEGNLTVTIADENNPDVLNIKVVVTGIFEINPKVEKELIHVETFKELFPLAKAIVLTITVNAGIPPIYVKDVDIDNEQIFRYNVKNKNRPKEDED